eukprot:s5534_g2.t1
MAFSWQYKLQDELDKEVRKDSFGWRTLGPTGSERLQSVFRGNIMLNDGFFLTTSPCVAFKWRCAEVLSNPLGLVLYRNDSKAGGRVRYMIAVPAKPPQDVLPNDEANYQRNMDKQDNTGTQGNTGKGSCPMMRPITSATWTSRTTRAPRATRARARVGAPSSARVERLL